MKQSSAGHRYARTSTQHWRSSSCRTILQFMAVLSPTTFITPKVVMGQQKTSNISFVMGPACQQSRLHNPTSTQHCVCCWWRGRQVSVAQAVVLKGKGKLLTTTSPVSPAAVRSLWLQ